MIYVNGNCYLQAIKIPPNLKQIWRVFVKSFGHSNIAHQIAVFFNLVEMSLLCKKQIMIAHTFIGSASKVSGSLMTGTCIFWGLIKTFCLHFDSRREILKPFNINVSLLNIFFVLTNNRAI